jgi:hypothetical protein
MEKDKSDLRASILTHVNEEEPISIDAEKSMTFLQYLHEIQRKIKSLNNRFFKEEEMVDSHYIQTSIEKIGKNMSESKQVFHFFKVSHGNITWK